MSEDCNTNTLKESSAGKQQMSFGRAEDYCGGDGGDAGWYSRNAEHCQDVNTDCEPSYYDQVPDVSFNENADCKTSGVSEVPNVCVNSVSLSKTSGEEVLMMTDCTQEKVEDNAELFDGAVKSGLNFPKMKNISVKPNFLGQIGMMCQDLDLKLSHLERKYGHEKIFDSPKSGNNNKDLSQISNQSGVEVDPQLGHLCDSEAINFEGAGLSSCESSEYSVNETPHKKKKFTSIKEQDLDISIADTEPLVEEPKSSYVSSSLKCDLKRKSGKSKYIWKNDPTVPTGWKTTSVTLNTFGRTMETKRYLAPNDKFCFTRIEALKYMLKSGISQHNDIEKMREPLLEQGWATDGNLPNGWMLKTKCDVSNSQVSFQYLSQDFNLFKSTKKVKEFMERDNRYTLKDIEALEHLLNSESNKLRKDKYEWMDGDETLPAGWKKRFVDCVNNKQKIFYLAPDGASFVCRRNALQHMIKQNYSEKDVEFMRENLSHDGWKISEHLPIKWRMKEVESCVKGVYSYDVKYLNDTGEMFSSTKAVVEHMKKDGQYTMEDIVKLEEKFFKQKKKKCSKKYEWISGDATVPAGWKIRHCTRKDGRNISYFLSPGGESFATRLQCLHYLIKENGAEIEEMRAKLEFENWCKSSVLPDKWLMKKSESYQNGQYQIDIRYLSSGGILFKSAKSVLEFMKESSNYTNHDVVKIETMVSELGKRSSKARYAWNENDDTVPKGWKTRVYEGKKTVKFFLAPDGTQFPCRRAGLQHMISQKYDQDEIEVMRVMLQFEGWEETEMLPSGWKFRRTEGTSKGVYNSECYFLSKEGQMFHSTKAAIEHMKEHEQYDDEDVVNIGVLLEDEIKKNRNEKYVWQEDPNLPDGWKFRSIVSKGVNKDYVLSPDGTQFSCRRLACVFMKSENYHNDLIERALSTLTVEGWFTHQRLPTGWRIRESNSSISFLSRDLEILKSNKAVLDYMGSNNYSDDELELFKLFTEDQQKWKRAENFHWESEDGLPKGWKIRSVKCRDNKIRVFILAPDGTQICGRRQAIDHILLKGYSVEDVTKMMKSLRKEGWMPDHSFLPDGWLKKRYVGKDKKPSYRYLTPANQKLQGLSSILEYMENDGEYLPEDMEKIRAKINSYNTAKMENLKNSYRASGSSTSVDNYEGDAGFLGDLDDDDDKNQSSMDEYEDDDEDGFINPEEIMQQNWWVSEEYKDVSMKDDELDNDTEDNYSEMDLIIDEEAEEHS